MFNRICWEIEISMFLQFKHLGDTLYQKYLKPLGGVAAYVDHTLDAEVYKQLAVEFVWTKWGWKNDTKLEELAAAQRL